MLDHISFTVKNLDESVRFYSKAFDMRIIREYKKEGEGLSAKVLSNDDEIIIELMESKQPKALYQQPGDMNQIGFTHIAFPTKNIEADIQKLVKLGAKVVRGPEMGDKTVKRWAFLEDLNGITIELIELRS